MPSRQGHTAPSSTLSAALHRIALTALAHASLVLVACMMAGALSGEGAEPYLRSTAVAFSLVGSFAVGRAIQAEGNSDSYQAENLYALSLMNYFVAYASILAHRLLETAGGS